MMSLPPGGWDDSFDAQMDETISSRCHKIQRQLAALVAAFEHEIINVSTSVTAFSIRDTLERFMLWAGNLGALQRSESKLSLDSRLAGFQDVRKFICTELEDMFQALTDLTGILDGSTPNRLMDDGLGPDEMDELLDDEPLDEADSLLQVISESLSSLFKAGILIRQPASSTRDRFERAIRSPKYTLPEKWDIDYAQQKYPKLGRGKLSKRMGRAITKRRQFIAYCRDHASRLAQTVVNHEEGGNDDDDNDRDTHYDDDDGESRVATSAVQSSKATTFVPKRNLMQALQEQRELEQYENDPFDDDATSVYSNLSISTTSEEMASLKLPRLADLSPDDRPFECPICFTLQQFPSENAWRRHAFKDLKAYLCTKGGKGCDEKLFEDRTSWFNHELEEHRSSYLCLLCVGGEGTGGTCTGKPDLMMPRGEFREHIRDFHGEFEKDQLDRFVETGRQPITAFNARDCPFCNEWSERLKKKNNMRNPPNPEGDVDVVVSVKRFRGHVAMHLEQLAIWAVPQHQTQMDEDDDGEGSVDLDSQHSGGGSGGSDREDEDDMDDTTEEQAEEEGQNEKDAKETASTDEAGTEIDEEAERKSKEKKMEEWQKHLDAAAKIKAEIEELERKEKEKEEEIRRKKEAEEEEIRKQKEKQDEIRKREEDRLRDMLWYV
ncbi:hypothetical protein QBC45DRAFT_423960 [Copromyces sp. CBS 386.78]|nr:hypothetical protein QBC45DRAFT_423960 [Copromyces sp. CBS 386.78]